MSTERTCDLFCCKTITSTIHLSCIRRIGCGTAGGPPGSVRSAGSAGSATSFIVGAGYLPTCLLASLDPTATMAAGDFSFLFLFFLFYSCFCFVSSFPLLVPLFFHSTDAKLKNDWGIFSTFHPDDWPLMAWWRTRLIGTIWLSISAFSTRFRIDDSSWE